MDLLLKREEACIEEIKNSTCFRLNDVNEKAFNFWEVKLHFNDLSPEHEEFLRGNTNTFWGGAGENFEELFEVNKVTWDEEETFN